MFIWQMSKGWNILQALQGTKRTNIYAHWLGNASCRDLSFKNYRFTYKYIYCCAIYNNKWKKKIVLISPNFRERPGNIMMSIKYFKVVLMTKEKPRIINEKL